MKFSRDEAFAELIEPAIKLGALWASAGSETVFSSQQPWQLMNTNRFDVHWRYVANRVDLSDQEWEAERVFGDLDTVLIWRLAFDAWKYVIELYLQDTETDPIVRRFLAVPQSTLRALQAEGLISDDQELGFREVSAISDAVAEELGEEWVRRGGRVIPKPVMTILMLFAREIENATDLTTGNSYDENGLPDRRPEGVLSMSIPAGCRDVALQVAAGRISLQNVGWDDFDFSALLMRAIANAAPLIMTERKQADQQTRIAFEMEAASKSLKDWQKFHHRPLVSPYGMNPDEAEAWVCTWMLHMGAKGAVTTQYVGDGGIDIQADNFIAQVKMYAGSVGIAALREFAGVAFMDTEGRHPLFFTTGRYPLAGPDLADRANMALFHFDLTTGEVSGANELGRIYATHGFIGPVELEKET